MAGVPQTHPLGFPPQHTGVRAERTPSRLVRSSIGLYTNPALVVVHHGLETDGGALAGVHSPVPGAHQPSVGSKQGPSHPLAARYCIDRGAPVSLRLRSEDRARTAMRRHAPQRRHQAKLLGLFRSGSACLKS
jgi:hypothetical protein